MSHFTTIKTQIRDVQALQAACTELGLNILEKAEARGFGDQRRHGDLVIQLHGPYDIAVNLEADGSYGLSTDWWLGHVEREVGKDFGRLLQAYAIHKASMEARQRGYTVKRESLHDGSVKLTIGGLS